MQLLDERGALESGDSLPPDQVSRLLQCKKEEKEAVLADIRRLHDEGKLKLQHRCDWLERERGEENLAAEYGTEDVDPESSCATSAGEV